MHGLRDLGLQPGDGICGLVPNGVDGLVLYLAALQAGWYYTPINWHLAGPEIAYIVGDSEAKAFFVHERFADDGVIGAADRDAERRFGIGAVPGFRDVAELTDGRPDTLPDERTAGATMHYTSGTTGRPKGVRRALTGLDPDDSAELMTFLLTFFGFTPGQPNAHLVTSPNYHTAVTQFGGSALHMGHSLVYMDRWDAEDTLRLIERHQDHQHAHGADPLQAAALASRRRRGSEYDVSSMRWAIHAAAPCPVPIKQAMLDWWGDCIWEYYAATEGGGTIATPAGLAGASRARSAAPGRSASC